MAGRGPDIELALRAAPFVFVAVLLHALAFIIWNIGTRAPSQLFADLRSGLGSAQTLTRGVWRFVLGSLLLIAGALLMLSVTIVDVRTEFSLLETGAVLTGLLVEMLVGEPVRAHLTNR